MQRLPCMGRGNNRIFLVSWDFPFVYLLLVSWGDTAADRWSIFLCASPAGTLRKCQAGEMGKGQQGEKWVTKLSSWHWTLIEENQAWLQCETGQKGWLHQLALETIPDGSFLSPLMTSWRAGHTSILLQFVTIGKEDDLEIPIVQVCSVLWLCLECRSGGSFTGTSITGCVPLTDNWWRTDTW